jgi:DNA-binding ferritin-like protein
MKIENLQSVLEETFSNNFVLYYRAHAAHINIVGPHFVSHHKLLGKIYEYLQGNIDILGEKIRTVRGLIPTNINTILEVSVMEDKEVVGDAEDMLQDVLDGIEAMIDQYHSLYQAAEEVEYIDISNFAQDEIATLAKYRWMLESTLDI